ncbi:MAG: ribonuclease III [Clostridia bacterium]|nr:ribonuclease III [Clostridia bacterium]
MDTLDIHTVSPLTLAFLGDGVYGLLVRERLVKQGNRPAGELHRESVELVRAEAQAAAMTRLMPVLTETELQVFKRGRNAHTSRSGPDYHHATGLEALFGWLYLQGDTARMQELFALAMGD